MSGVPSFKILGLILIICEDTFSPNGLCVKSEYRKDWLVWLGARWEPLNVARMILCGPWRGGAPEGSLWSQSCSHSSEFGDFAGPPPGPSLRTGGLECLGGLPLPGCPPGLLQPICFVSHLGIGLPGAL